MEAGSAETEQPLEMEVEEEEEVAPIYKEPPKIKRLEESVVNRIAAGEVIQRPVSAVKELVENSLDADSTSISVVVKDGGLKLIQVSDDGHGIRYEDLPILCERHTTSKLSHFEDLQTIQSMGFRGEALASMTYVGHVTVTTIMKGQLHGYRATYRDGVMEQEPKPCAAVKGTQIMVENLFYNMIARRKTLQNSADDYPKIVDLLSRFAIHHINVGFSCRKHGAARADVHSVATSSRLDAIRSVYGVSVARNLIKIEAFDDESSSSVFKMEGFISNLNYIGKKITMVLFINNRLVECGALKRAVEIVYSATLPKASKPFIYMSIILPSEHVDVNVHPTKRERCFSFLVGYIHGQQYDLFAFVMKNAQKQSTYYFLREKDQFYRNPLLIHILAAQLYEVPDVVSSERANLLTKVSLLHQEIIIEKIQSAVESRLRNSNECRTFQEQTGDASTSSLLATQKDSPKNPTPPSSQTPKSEKVPVHKMVRIDSLDPAGRLHAYLQATPSSQADKSSLASIRSAIRQRRNPRETADLTSVQELVNIIDGNYHSGLLDTIRNCTYIGMADEVFALIQHNTHLYLANVVNLSKELMYQQVLRRFAHFNAIQLSDPAPLADLLMLALKEEDLDAEGQENYDLKEKIAEMNTQLLKQKAEMLQEYFGIHIDTNGNLARLPVILDQYTPDMDHVPEFVLCLGNDVGGLYIAELLPQKRNFLAALMHVAKVDWDDEKICFQTIAAAIGNFYAMHPPLLPNPSGEGLQFYKRRVSSNCHQAGEGSSKDADDAAVESEYDDELLADAENAWAQREWSIQHILFPSIRLFLKPPTSMASNGTFVQVASLEKLYKIFERC